LICIPRFCARRGVPAVALELGCAISPSTQQIEGDLSKSQSDVNRANQLPVSSRPVSAFSECRLCGSQNRRRHRSQVRGCHRYNLGGRARDHDGDDVRNYIHMADTWRVGTFKEHEIRPFVQANLQPILHLPCINPGSFLQHHCGHKQYRETSMNREFIPQTFRMQSTAVERDRQCE
jgi:hypothetical protein